MTSTADWRRLGQEIAQARLAAGHRDTAAWADKVGRSTRVLLGLERGERQGRKTLEAVELALEWPAGKAHRILFGSSDDDETEEPAAQPVGLGLDAEADGLPSEDVEAIRAQVRALKRARGLDG